MTTSPASSGSHPRQILVIEPDAGRALVLALALSSETTSVTVARTRDAVVRAFKSSERQPDAAVVSWVGDALWPRTVLEVLHGQRRPCVGLVVVDDPADVDALIAAGHHDVLVMPAGPEALVTAVDRVCAATDRVRAVLRTLPRPARKLRRHSRPMLRGRNESGRRIPSVANDGRRETERAVERVVSVPEPEAPPKTNLIGTFERAVDSLAQRTSLSCRERSVFRLIAMGCAYPEIGRQLSISARTVKMHAANVRLKTGADSRADLVRTLFAS